MEDNIDKLDFLRYPPINENRRILHSFFKFPGSFHPPLIKEIISKHKSALTIGDPLCGSGTVALEAIVQKRNVVSMDIDPLSCLMTKVKTNPISTEILNDLSEIWISSISKNKTSQRCDKIAENLIKKVEKNTKYKLPTNVFHWFDPYIVIELSDALLKLEEIDFSNTYYKTILEAILGASIRRVSKADPNPVSGLEVTKIMRSRLNKGLSFNLVKELQNRSSYLIKGYDHLLSKDKIGYSYVFSGDILCDWAMTLHKKNIEMDLIITSPPYCNAIEYWRRHRLEYIILGLLKETQIRDESRKFIGTNTSFIKELQTIDDLELNSQIGEKIIKKLKNKKRNKKANILKKYFIDSENWIKEAHSTLNQNGNMYIIIGPSTSYGIKINTPSIINEICLNNKLNSKIIKTFKIKNQRMQYKTKNNIRINTESIIKITK